MTTNNTALKSATTPAPRPALVISTCRINGCGRKIVGDPLVPALEVMTSQGKTPLAQVDPGAWICCRTCAQALARQFPGTRFFSLAETREMIEHRLAVRAARAGTHAFKVGLGASSAQPDRKKALMLERRAHQAVLAERNRQTLAALGLAS